MQGASTAKDTRCTNENATYSKDLRAGSSRPPEISTLHSNLKDSRGYSEYRLLIFFIRGLGKNR